MVQVIYLLLAVIMGGGLVLFGIGGNTNGGLFDAFSSDSNKSTPTTSYSKEIKTLEKRVAINPKNAPAWARLASLRLAEGGSRGGFDGDKDGIAEFRQASAAWTKYVALEPKPTNLNVARQMVNLYGPTGLNQPDKAVGVLDIIVDETQPPEADLYKQYAVYAYTAGQTRKGDLAAEKAVSLSPKADRKTVKDALQAQKTSITQQAAQAATSAAGAQTATPG
ncbi:MAG: hypothetical protein JWM31_2001, partial [Solirubrobacterales bacterium]|nr:hypothetical protein [Solirubrobacterales bacterium]